jgi:hypothetical protein
MSNTRIHFELSDPVPTISDKIVLFIDKKINELNFAFFIEYGSKTQQGIFKKKYIRPKKSNFYSNGI